MIDKRCPNCGGDMLYSGGKSVCPYCDTEITIEQSQISLSQNLQKSSNNNIGNEITDIALKIIENCNGQKFNAIAQLREATGLGLKEAKEIIDSVWQGVPFEQKQTISKSLFRMHDDVTDTERSAKAWKSLCNALNSEYSIDQYKSFLNQIATSRHECATSEIHSDLYQKAYVRISPLLEAGESLLLWSDYGIFSQNAKDGLGVTNRSLFFARKKAIVKCFFKDISMIKRGGSGNWYLNQNGAYWIGSIGCSDEQIGIIIAFALKNALDINGEGYKIDVYKD